MQTSDVRKFEKIGPEKGTTMFLVKVTKYQIASSSTREVRERKEDRKEGRAGSFCRLSTWQRDRRGTFNFNEPSGKYG